MTEAVAIVGAGLCGNLLAILLARRGFDVTVYERDSEPAAGRQPSSGGRSINLALAARGMRALERADAIGAIEPLLLPMRGRIVHEPNGENRFLPYGQHADECIWSVSRLELNRTLIGIARSYANVDYRFGHRLTELDAASLTATFESSEGLLTLRPPVLLAADGAGSTARRQLAGADAVTASEDLLDHGYKELAIPPLADGEFALDPGGLHIWPRGGFMLIALPNRDRSFTATLFLPRRGQPSFAALTARTVTELFDRSFADVIALMPNLLEDFSANPIGTLGTVRCAPWHATAADGSGRALLLIGDAAHGIVPFHGQGMNAAFEDCAEVDRLVGEIGPGWGEIAASFEQSRRGHAAAIAEMALENYEEMRDKVRDPDFERRAALAFELERRFPGRFIPRYSMVMFHPEIGYAEAQRRGRIQAGILDQALTHGNAEAALQRASALTEQLL